MEVSIRFMKLQYQENNASVLDLFKQNIVKALR